MNIYLLSQYTRRGYDTFDSCVVIAESEEDAKTINPAGGWDREEWRRRSWCSSIDDVNVELIGKALEGSVKGIVIASFNAG